MCKPCTVTEPMYMEGRRRTASKIPFRMFRTPVGYSVALRTEWRLEWQMPQNSISICK